MLLEQQKFAPWWSFCIWTVQPEPLVMVQSGLEPISPSLFLCGTAGMWVLMPGLEGSRPVRMGVEKLSGCPCIMVSCIWSILS